MDFWTKYLFKNSIQQKNWSKITFLKIAWFKNYFVKRTICIYKLEWGLNRIVLHQIVFLYKNYGFKLFFKKLIHFIQNWSILNIQRFEIQTRISEFQNLDFIAAKILSDFKPEVYFVSFVCLILFLWLTTWRGFS